MYTSFLILVNIHLAHFAVEIPLPKKADILPLVLIKHHDEFFAPTFIRHAAFLKDKPGLGGGTKFDREHETGEQMFFCPADSKYLKRIQHAKETGMDIDERCLFVKTFLSCDELKCDKTAMPIVRKVTEMNMKTEQEEDVRCGQDDVGNLYEFVYQDLPCESITHFPIYKFCYEHLSKTTLYTEHDSNAANLFRYDEMSYDMVKVFAMMTEGYDYFGSDFKELEKAYTSPPTLIRSKKQLFTINEDLSDVVSQPVMQFKHKSQKMVPPNHMPFALWKRATFHYANTRLQHERLMPLWDEINNHLLEHFKSMYAFSHAIYTGAFEYTDQHDKSYVFGNNVPVPDIWVRLVMEFEKKESSNGKRKGIAVIMSNHIKDIIGKKIINSYCEINSCEKALLDKFQYIGGYIRCCPATFAVQELFNINLTVHEELEIRKINHR